MIIEFLGISGVGKTTVAKQYIASEKENGNEIYWPTQSLYANKSWIKRNMIKGFVVLGRVLLHPLWSIRLLLFLVRTGMRLKDVITLFFNGVYLKYNLCKAAKGNGIYLFDEGVVQFVWSICLRIDKEITGDEIVKAVSFWGIPDKLHVVQAPADVIEQRLILRGGKKRIFLYDDLNATIRKMQKKENCIIDVLTEKCLLEKDAICYIHNV